MFRFLLLPVVKIYGKQFPPLLAKVKNASGWIGTYLKLKESRATLACFYRTSGRFLHVITHACIMQGCPLRA